jgi:hypothetical protein
MFTTGQWIFAGSFLFTFICVMIYVYRKDLALHKKYYKGSYWILLSFLAFIAILFFIKYYVKDNS